jgi:hypothetical protein
MVVGESLGALNVEVARLQGVSQVDKHAHLEPGSRGRSWRSLSPGRPQKRHEDFGPAQRRSTAIG